MQSVDSYGGAWTANVSVRDDHGTSHISVVDKARMAVAITTTINTGFGSKVYSSSTGERLPAADLHTNGSPQ